MVATSYFKKKVFVGQRGIANESYGIDDMSDLYARNDGAQGYPASIRSETYFWDKSVWFMRPTDLLYGINLRTPMLEQDAEVYWPVVPKTIESDTITLNDTPAELKNKIIKPSSNLLTGIEKFPDYAKSGKYQGNNYKGEGIMESLIHVHIPELKGDSVEGSYAQYATPTTAERYTGYSVPNPYLTMTKFEPVVKCKIRVNDWSVATNRFYFGLVSADSILQNDVPFGNGDAALLLGFRKDDGDFKMFRGVGDNITTVSPYSTNENMNHVVHTLEFGFRREGQELYYNIDDKGEVTFTSGLPQTNKWLKLHMSLQNVTTNDRHLDCFYTRIESKK